MDFLFSGLLGVSQSCLAGIVENVRPHRERSCVGRAVTGSCGLRCDLVEERTREGEFMVCKRRNRKQAAVECQSW